MKPSKWTEDKLKFLKENSEILSLKELENIIGISYCYISLKAKSLNLPLKNKVRKLSDEDLIFLKKNSDKYSIIELAKLMNRNNSYVGKAIKKYGLPLKNNFSGNKYKYNKDYFEDIDSEEKGYWVGMIAADGCIAEGEGRLRLKISLKRADKSHLEKFNRAIDGNIEIKDVKAKYNGGISDASLIVVNCTKMCRDLMNHNVKPRKTYSTVMSDIPYKFIKDYLRAYIDGDGCYYFKRTPKRLRYSVEIISHGTSILEFFKMYLSEYGVTSYIYEKKDSGNLRYKLMICQFESIYRLINHIYHKDASVYLERKYKQAMELKSVYENEIMKR